MKNKKTNDPLETQSWALEVITDPYQVIAHCFNLDDIAGYRCTIRQVLLSASSSKVHRKSDPATVLRQFKAITSVILAAKELCHLKKSTELKIADKQLMEKRLYAKPYSICPEWDYMPRLLNTTEYKNPYLVFRRLLKCHDVPKWKALMDEIIDYAFASYADKCDLNLLALFLHFTKLMEAAHLIDVREITHVGGYLKPGIVLQANP